MRSLSACEALLAHLRTTRLPISGGALPAFKGESLDLGWGRVFGGQLVGQAMDAASQTLDGMARMPPHGGVSTGVDGGTQARTVADTYAATSVSTQFLRPGNVQVPVEYTVESPLDGRSFAARTVTARQRGKVVALISSSWSAVTVSNGSADHQLEHQDVVMPGSVPAPEDCPAREATLEAWADRYIQNDVQRERLLRPGPIEIRPVGYVPPPTSPDKDPPEQHAWLRARGGLASEYDSPLNHVLMLAYASDFALLATALRPHGVGLFDPSLQIASLNHSVYFHRPAKFDGWNLHSMTSPSMSGTLGYATGSIFDTHGLLVASTVQQGLVRMKAAPRPKPFEVA